MNSSFSSITPILQLAWDSSSLDPFKQCPRKYYYSIVLNYRSADESVHLTFGNYYHKGQEFYSKARAIGDAHEQAQEAMVLYILPITWINDRPWYTGDQYKNRLTLLRSLVWYTEEHQDD